MVRATLLACALVQMLAAAPAAAEQRIALVIGNGAYKEGRLPNPPNDARLIARTLRSLGFTVIERIDGDLAAMNRAIGDFGEMLERAEKDAVGLLYYAGHGVQSNGKNYLLPVDTRIDREADLRGRAIDADWIIQTMQDARARVNLVILDACRNNPFTRSFRSASRGLAQVNAAAGMLISYSTAPGSVAADGDGSNSPFTAALAKALGAPGISATQLFQQVRREVLAATQGQQTPWESSSLTDDFYFKASPAAGPTATPPGATAAPAADAELVFWQSIQGSNDPADFEAYRKQFPKGRFSALANNRLAQMRRQLQAAVPPKADSAHSIPPPSAPAPTSQDDSLFWQSIKDSTRAGEFEAYLAQFPSGRFAVLARNRIRDLKNPPAPAPVQQALAPPPAQAPPPARWSQVRIVTEGAYMPWNGKDSSGRLVGFEIELADHLCRRMGVQCEVVAHDWDGIIPSLLTRRHDVIMAGMNITPKRLETIDFTRPYAAGPHSFAVRKSSPLARIGQGLRITLGKDSDVTAATIDALRTQMRGKVVGAQMSTSNAAFIEQHFRGVASDIRLYRTTEQHDKDLAAGQIDAVLAAASYWMDVMSKPVGQDLTMIGPMMSGDAFGRGVGIGVRKEDAALRKMLDDALAIALKDGTVRTISTRWFKVDLTPAE